MLNCTLQCCPTILSEVNLVLCPRFFLYFILYTLITYLYKDGIGIYIYIYIYFDYIFGYNWLPCVFVCLSHLFILYVTLVITWHFSHTPLCLSCFNKQRLWKITTPSCHQHHHLSCPKVIYTTLLWLLLMFIIHRTG